MKVIGIAAISLDGCITKHELEGTAFTSKEDKEYFHKALEYFDSSIFGRKTFVESKEHLLRNLTEKRLKIVLTSEPSKFREYSQPGKLEFKSGKIEEIIKELEDRGRTGCAILGGTRVYTDAIRANVMDELWLTVEPIGFGTGKRLFQGNINFNFKLIELDRLSESTLLLKYKIITTPN